MNRAAGEKSPAMSAEVEKGERWLNQHLLLVRRLAQAGNDVAKKSFVRLKTARMGRKVGDTQRIAFAIFARTISSPARGSRWREAGRHRVLAG